MPQPDLFEVRQDGPMSTPGPRAGALSVRVVVNHSDTEGDWEMDTVSGAAGSKSMIFRRMAGGSALAIRSLWRPHGPEISWGNQR